MTEQFRFRAYIGKLPSYSQFNRKILAASGSLESRVFRTSKSIPATPARGLTRASIEMCIFSNTFTPISILSHLRRYLSTVSIFDSALFIKKTQFCRRRLGWLLPLCLCNPARLNNFRSYPMCCCKSPTSWWNEGISGS